MSGCDAHERAPRVSETFSRACRILGRQDFLRVQRDGRRVHTPSFVIMVLPAVTQRMGITITRKVAGAVGRNRVKRLVREVFRRNRELFPEACEFVLVARAGADRLDYETVRQELVGARSALARAARGANRAVDPERAS